MGAQNSRKEAIRAYKERKPCRGAFAVRCTGTGHVWVGSSPNLDKARNGIWFGLNLGSYIDKNLQAEWNTHGEPAFEYEILEKLDEDVPAMAVQDLLKEKKGLWAERLAARTLL
jgi:hypothetical protein